MNMTHLKYAAEVARTGSISQAAENLFMSQPNLSKAIKEFESHLGFAVFNRTSRGMEPTARGAELLVFGEKILAEIAEMERRYVGGEDPDAKFSIAVPRAGYITQAFSLFVNELPIHDRLDFHFEETDGFTAADAVATGRCDLGIARCRLEDRDCFDRLLREKGLAHRPVFTYTCRLLLGAAHPLARQENLSPAALAPYIEILPASHRPSALRAAVSAGESRRRIRVSEQDSPLDLLRRVKDAYMWSAPLPEELLRCYGLVEKSCGDNHRYCDLLFFQTGRRFAEKETLFLEKLETVVAEISGP